MKAFITGGTGFIGERLTRALLGRGYQVNALARSHAGAAKLQALGATPVRGDIAAIKSMRAGMKGCDMVFHLAGWYKHGSRDWEKAEAVNVNGTRNVLGLACELGVPKILYTSTVAVNGDTHGYLADETYLSPAGPFLTEYDRTKWMAHYKVARPMIEQGAPIIILMPGAVYGPGDTSLVGQLMRYFYMGLFPVLPGPELTLCYTHIDDVVEGIILAAEKGKPGESYILAGQVATLAEITQLWAQITGRRAALLHVPGRYVKPFAPVMARLGTRFPIPPILSRDAIAILEATYIARSDKARQQLGWQTRPLADGMRETFEHIAQTTRPLRVEIPAGRREQAAAIALGIAMGLLAAWLLRRRRR
ncbi:MAG: NAD-dependent epimerase/dehydratase family protein [Anaerolineales bacterium]|nr:NAD-dependent epimerase/dehydratase family protein [Anaerolineales bacterium]